jgi:hypothetical protein
VKWPRWSWSHTTHFLFCLFSKESVFFSIHLLLVLKEKSPVRSCQEAFFLKLFVVVYVPFSLFRNTFQLHQRAVENQSLSILLRNLCSETAGQDYVLIPTIGCWTRRYYESACWIILLVSSGRAKKSALLRTRVWNLIGRSQRSPCKISHALQPENEAQMAAVSIAIW